MVEPIQVKILNCQSIESLEFEIRGFTTVIGKSNIGKSAIIRSIAGAITNSPVGSLVRKGSKYCSVTLQSKNWGFKWEKGAGVSRYFIPANEEKPLDKVGAGQIEPIAEMGFRSVSLGRSDTYPWYASQFEPLFLLTETGATVTDFISEVSRLQVLQEAINISARGRKKALEEARVRSVDLEKLREKVERVAGFAQLAKVASELEEQAKSVREYERRILLAEEAFRKLEMGREVLLAVEALDRVRIPKDRISDDIDSLRLMAKRHKELLLAAQKVITLKAITSLTIPQIPSQEIEQLRVAKRFEHLPKLQKSVEVLDHVQRVKIHEVDTTIVQDIRKLKRGCQFQSKLRTFSDSVQKMSAQVTIPNIPPDPKQISVMVNFARKIEQNKNEIIILENKLQKIVTELDSVQTEIKSIPSCPTCNRVVNSTNSNQHNHKSEPQKRI